MARKLVLALLCAAVAVAAARELAQAQVTVADLPKQLQQLNSRLASIASTSSKKAGVASLLAGVEAADYEPHYKHKKYEDKYDKYEDKYDKYDKYEKYDKYDKYEKEDSYGYYPSKVTTKVYEKFRSHLRPQEDNKNTFQFTSELTCQNPEGEEGPEHEDGIIGFPIVSERMKLVTIGVCEWTVTQVKAQRISDHATLKGNTQVVCTFSEEAGRHCKNGDILEKGLTISGQGLVYNFEHEPEADKAATKDAKAKDGEEEEEGIDVYLTLINGVVNASKHLKYDNGALQYFFGPPATVGEKGRDAAIKGEIKKGDPTGEYTIVFKN